MVDENKNIIKNEQTKGLKRNTIDKFYTKDTIVTQCINIIKKNIIIENNDLIIEPSAGNGAFIKEIKELSCNFKFYDINPEHKEIIKQNFLDLENSQSDNKIHIIGNPPFGRQSSMAIKFIKKSCEFANTISFILPKSFKKDSLKKHFNKYFHLINEIDLADNSFLVNDKETDVAHMRR
jgi:predicted RNA methylase